MWYKGNEKRCQDYNAIVSYNLSYKGIANKNDVNTIELKEKTNRWANVEEIDGNFYIKKHPDYDGAYLAEVAELPFIETI